MKIARKKKTFDKRHIVAVVMTLGIFAIAIFCFPYAFRRLIEALRDIGLSIAFYFCEIFKIEHSIEPTVTEFSALPLRLPFNFPETWEAFKESFSRFWDVFANLDNFKSYFASMGHTLYKSSRILILLLPIFIVIWILLIRIVESHNNRYGAETRPLRLFKKISDKTYRPAKRWVLSLKEFLLAHRYYLTIWFWTMAYAFGWVVIVLEFFAFYFYFVMSFDFGGIYRQVVKLLYDLSPMLDFVPTLGWIVFGYVIFDMIRKNIAFQRLRHMEMMNRGFIAERPISILDVGTMGSKKTTHMSDMALSMDIMFRDKALERIREADIQKFPYFPWINFENSIVRAMDENLIFNLSNCETWVLNRKRFFLNNGTSRFIFGYDFKRYGLKYDNKMYVEDIWDVLVTYAKLYFIYVVHGSLLLANYSIRTDSVLQDQGNFPLWDTDFFSRESTAIDEQSDHAHILDFDMLRLGRKVLEANAKADAFEFGGVVMTEIGKERGNALDLQEIKKNTDETNQKNDLFNAWLKLVRHSSTVDNFPFVKVFTDEQRPESWGADARDLCEIVHIEECSDLYLAMPFYHLGELLHDWLFGKFINTYTKHRFYRGDTTLLMYLLKSVTSFFHRRHVRLYNRFGFMKMDLAVEKGTQDGVMKECKYFLMPKKIYARRFSTDAFAEYFNEKALRSKIGLEDLPTYKTEKATMDELKLQNSYWIRDLVKIHSGLNVSEPNEDVGFLDELKKI